jgi:peroxiredoxin
MRNFIRSATLCLALLQAAPAAPADAERVKADYKAEMAKWNAAVSAATTAEARMAAWNARPDPAGFARKMWTVISPSLGEDWVADPMAWFIGLTINLQAPVPAAGDPNQPPAPPADARQFGRELDTIATAVTSYHLTNQKLAPVCLAYAAGSDPKSFALLEKLQTAHKVPAVQGVAALATAMRLRSLGDDPELMSRRLKLLRKAIIDSADVEVSGVTVAKLAQDELYVIRNLTKGRIAPDLTGMDSGSRPMKLSDHKGKVVVLLFWNSGVTDVVRLLESMNALRETHADKGVALVGVNNDTVANLRSIQQSDADLLGFPNFSDPRNELSEAYRVGTWPLVYVLDRERKIQYVGTPGSFVNAAVAALLEPAAKPAPGK